MPKGHKLTGMSATAAQRARPVHDTFNWTMFDRCQSGTRVCVFSSGPGNVAPRDRDGTGRSPRHHGRHRPLHPVRRLLPAGTARLAWRRTSVPRDASGTWQRRAVSEEPEPRQLRPDPPGSGNAPDGDARPTPRHAIGSGSPGTRNHANVDHGQTSFQRLVARSALRRLVVRGRVQTGRDARAISRPAPPDPAR